MTTNRRSFGLKSLDPAFIVAGILTTAFYGVVTQPAFHGSLLARYTTEHLVDYVIVILWIWAVTDLVFRVCGFPRELLALREHWLPARSGKDSHEAAAVMLRDIRHKPTWLKTSRIGQRLTGALEYLVQKESAEDFRDHIHYLAALDEEKTFTNYSLQRFVIAVTPVLGFLGTVVHFGTALSGISFDEMASKLPHVVSEMGQAFNTTTTALAAAMSMMFALFLCERVEKGFVHQIDRLCDREFINRFEVKNGELSPFLTAIHQANDEALKTISNTLSRHTDLWLAAFSGILEKFDQRQAHDQQNWTQMLALLDARHESLESQRIGDQKKHIGEWKDALAQLTEQHQYQDVVRERRLVEIIETIDERQLKWIEHLDGTFTKALSLREDLTATLDALNRIHSDESRLVEVQTTLSKNLRIIHETQKIDEALHGLTGAIHLLTARHRSSDVSDRAAA